MIVACPDCGARYRVREEKLPPGGGNIQCPACSHVFAALANVATAARVTGVSGQTPSAAARPTQSEPAPTTMLSQQTRPRAESPFHTASGSHEAPPRRAPTGAVAAASPFGTPSAPQLRAAGPSAPPSVGTDATAMLRPPEPEPTVALSVPSRTAPGPGKPAREQWKLRSPVGLVYDFPDLAALRSWLSSRDSVDGMSASRDGGVTWELLTAFSELRSSLPKSARLALTRSEQGAESARTTMLPSPARAAASSGAQPPAARPAMTTVLTPPSGEPPPAAPQPSGSYAMAPAADSPLRRERVTPDPLPTTRLEPTLATGGAGPKRATARPTLRSGGHPAVPSSAGPAARSERPGRQPVVDRRRPTTPGTRPRVGSRPQRPVARKAGAGTWLGLLLIGGLVVAGALQLTGTVDLVGELGLRGAPEPSEVAQPAPGPAGPPVAETVAVAPTRPAEPSPGEAAPLPGEPLTDADLRVVRRRGLNPHASRIATLTSQARDAASDGRIEEAIDLVNNALQFDRNNPDAVCLLADLQREAGSFGDAESLAARCDALRSPGAGTEP